MCRYIRYIRYIRYRSLNPQVSLATGM